MDSFIRELPEEVDKDRTWQWLSTSDLKIGTEALLCAARGTSYPNKLCKVSNR